MLRSFLIGILCVLNIVIWWKAQYFSMLSGYGDFWDAKNYLRTIADLKQGAHPYELPYMETLGPPLVIAPYVPLSFFTEKVAMQIFTLVSLLSGIATCFLVAKQILGGRYVWETALFLNILLFSAFPTRFNFITGQWGLLAVLLLTLLVTKTSQSTKGIALGLLIAFKTFFIFTAFSLVEKKPRVVLFSAITLLLVVASTLSLLKLEFYLDYQQRFSGVMWQPDRIVDVAYYNQSFKTTLSRLGLVNSSVSIWIFVSVIAAGYLMRSGNLGAAIVLSIQLSPVAWQHYYVLLFPLFWLSLRSIRKTWLLLIWLIALSLWWVEFPWLHQLSVEWWSGLWASHYFLSGMLLTGILVYNYHHEA